MGVRAVQAAPWERGREPAEQFFVACMHPHGDLRLTAIATEMPLPNEQPKEEPLREPIERGFLQRARRPTVHQNKYRLRCFTVKFPVKHADK